jgi:MFS family permease
MAQPARAGDVLTALDERAPSAYYWQLTLLATLGGFVFGYDTSNIGSALNFVPYHLHGLMLGYLVSGASLGAAAGAILGGPASDRFGRKPAADRGCGDLRRRRDLVRRGAMTTCARP